MKNHVSKLKNRNFHIREENPKFQLLSFNADKTDGSVYVIGRSDKDQRIGVKFEYEHAFLLARQSDFKNDDDVASTLAVIEAGLHVVAAGNATNRSYGKYNGGDKGSSRTFLTPDPYYESKTAYPKTVYVNPKLITPETRIITGWTPYYEDHKSIYGHTPAGYRDAVVMIYVSIPCFSTLIHEYIESDHFRTYYTRVLRYPDDVFYKGGMLMTYEATIPLEIVIRTKYLLYMGRWCAIDTTSSTCYEIFSEQGKTISCDRYFECSGYDLCCDLTRDDNANIVLASFDIECPGAKKKDGTSRFPIPYWGQTTFMEYAKNVLSLPPPVGSYVLPSSSSSFSSSISGRPKGPKGRYGNLRPAAIAAIAVSEDRDDSVLDEENNVIEAEDSNGNEGEEEQEDNTEENRLKIHNAWIKPTKYWGYDEWKSWLKFAIRKKYDETEISELLSAADMKNIDDLIPNVLDTDRVRCICMTVKRIGDYVGDNPLSFYRRICYVYVDPLCETPMTNHPQDKYASNIWGFGDLEVKLYESEAKLIYDFLEDRNRVGADIAVSWNGKQFDDVYIRDRLFFLEKHGTDTDKKYAKDVTFGSLLGEKYKARCVERFVFTKAMGERLNRTVTQDGLIHNDGLEIITNQSFGEKNRENTLDYIAMTKLVHSRSNIDKAMRSLIDDGAVDYSALKSLYCKVAGLDEDKVTDHLSTTTNTTTLESNTVKPNDVSNTDANDIDKDKIVLPDVLTMLNSVFEDVPMRKMMVDMNSALDSCLKGGTEQKDLVEYCYVDTVLPLLIGGKLSLQLALAKAANVSPEDVFNRGVQLKVLSLLWTVCKEDFGGLYIIPDKGSLGLYWPGVFKDLKLGFVKAITTDPRMKEFIVQDVKKNSKDTKPKTTTDIEDVVVGNKPMNTVNKTLPINVNKSRGTGARGRPTTKTKTKAPPVAKPPKKPSTTNKRAGYTGAYVIPPAIRGLISEPVSTLDFGALYPSIMYSRGLCFTTLLTRKIIELYGLEPWEYTRYILGMASEISCGEYLRDAKIASEKGYHSPELKVAYFYSADPKTTVYGTLITKLKTLRKAAKDKMEAAGKAIEDIDVHLEDGKPLVKGSRQEKMILVDNIPITLVRRTLCMEQDLHDNAQLALKICNNSGYGFPGVQPAKAILPCMEISAAVTCVGRSEINQAKAIAQRLTASLGKEYVKTRNDIIEEESVPNPEDVNERLKKTDGKPYSVRHITPSYVQSKSPKGRLPLVDCSVLKQVSDAWLYETRHSRISRSKYDVIYGDTDSIMFITYKGTFDLKTMEGLRALFETCRYVAFHVNRFEYEQMVIVYEKTALGMQLTEKKNYKMRLVSEVNGKMREILERGSSIRRDFLPFVKKIIDCHKYRVLEALAQDQPLTEVLKGIESHVKSALDDLYRGEFVLDDLIVSKKINKIAYVNNPEQAVVAEKKKRRGTPVSTGSTVFYLFAMAEFTAADFVKYEAYLQKKEKESIQRKKDFELRQQRKRMNQWRKSIKTTNRNEEEEEEKEEERRRRREKEDRDIERVDTFALKSDKKTPVFKRNHKGVDLAEDAQYIKDTGLPVDVRYIFEHRIEKPLLAYFAPMFFPRNDMPYVDTDRMDPSQIVKVVQIQKKIQKEQQEATKKLLFGEFYEKIDKKITAICDNAYRDYLEEKKAERTSSICDKRKGQEIERADKQEDVKRRRVSETERVSSVAQRQPQRRFKPTTTTTTTTKALPSQSQGLLRYFTPVPSRSVIESDNHDESQVLDHRTTTTTTTTPIKSRIPLEKSPKIRYCECINCNVILKLDVNDNPFILDRSLRSTGNDETKRVIRKCTLPGTVCDSCKGKTDSILSHLSTELQRLKKERAIQALQCRGCVYLLDKPFLDVSQCKSSHCSVYQAKKNTESAITYKTQQENLFNCVKNTIN